MRYVWWIHPNDFISIFLHHGFNISASEIILFWLLQLLSIMKWLIRRVLVNSLQTHHKKCSLTVSHLTLFTFNGFKILHKKPPQIINRFSAILKSDALPHQIQIILLYKVPCRAWINFPHCLLLDFNTSTLIDAVNDLFINMRTI